MTKTYIVSGATWLAEVELDQPETMSENDIQIEAATRAVERHIKKIPIEGVSYSSHKNPIKVDESYPEVYSSIIEMMVEELEKGCGIGGLLCIMGYDNSSLGEECYVNSRDILVNVGLPKLVNVYDKRYPTTPTKAKRSKQKKKNKR
jgi:hypothetical protein